MAKPAASMHKIVNLESCENCLISELNDYIIMICIPVRHIIRVNDETGVKHKFMRERNIKFNNNSYLL